MESFDEKVWQLLKKIPKGKVATYKQLAMALGKPNASRAVGNACSKNPSAPKVPCHRVVKSSGKVGGYARGVHKKIALLQGEGVEICNARIINLNRFLAKL